MIAGRKQWQRAVELQMCAIAAPSIAGNAIVMDCYKSYVLVNLIAHGEADKQTALQVSSAP